MILTLEEVKNHIRVDIDDDDALIENIMVAAESYLANATGKDYPETDENGAEINYALEKIFLLQLIAHWYENRDSNDAGSGAGLTQLTRSLLVQLQNK